MDFEKPQETPEEVLTNIANLMESEINPEKDSSGMDYADILFYLDPAFKKGGWSEVEAVMGKLLKEKGGVEEKDIAGITNKILSEAKKSI